MRGHKMTCEGVCLSGFFGDSIDEDLRNTGKCIANELKKCGIQLALASSSLAAWIRMKESVSDATHFVSTPRLCCFSLKAHFIMQILEHVCKAKNNWQYRGIWRDEAGALRSIRKKS
jgi:hypothetical protein